MQEYNDLELVDKYIEECLRFVNPQLFNMIVSRGLYDIVNYLPNNVQEAKAVARARLAKIGKSFGDEEIDHIANEIQRIEFIQNQLSTMNMADVHKTLPLIEEMRSKSEFIKEYYKAKTWKN